FDLTSELGTSTADMTTWRLIEGWMENCVTNHGLCRHRAEEDLLFRPTRLLELAPGGTYRLVNGSDCPAVLQYVALSYCWGKQPAHTLLRLLRTTHEQLSKNSPVSALPKTFRDAAEVTRRAGVSYLWIDRLCIYQDSVEDWRREAPAMNKVYRNAKFSIAALGAHDSDGGLFSSRDPAKIRPSVVRFNMVEEGQPVAYTMAVDIPQPLSQLFAREPLADRAWVVQERLLAPRTIYFGSQQVVWECRETKCSETWPLESAQSGSGSMELRDCSYKNLCAWKDLVEFLQWEQRHDEPSQLFSDWYAVASHYSGRSLTVSADKLVAISGLAKDMRDALCKLKPGRHRYLAGLWEETLVESLAWRVRTPLCRAAEYRAPSWSWACLDGPLHLPSFRGRGTHVLYSTLDAADVIYRDDDDTGEVCSGTITLRGPCAAMQIDAATPYRYPGDRESSGLPEDGSKRRWIGIEGRDGYIAPDVPERALANFDTMDDVTGETTVLWLTCHINDWMQIREGILLRPLTDGTYHRIGYTNHMFYSHEVARDFIDKIEERRVVIV
ncbi:heterokaryon incompatibility protein-domain-containing protein, partial [Microdochium bolleyi]